MRDYELMLISRAELEEERQRALLDRVTGLIAEYGGVVGKVDVWGKRRLAYPIKHQGDGYYTVVELQGENPCITELDRVLSINDEVLRFKIFVREQPREAEGGE